MIEIVLIGVILILCGLLGWNQRESRLERNKLVNAILAKNAQEMANLDLADKTEIKVKPNNQESSYVPMENLSDEDFKKAVL